MRMSAANIVPGGGGAYQAAHGVEADPILSALACCSGFGELALLYSAPRAATVRASSPCKLWVMDRAVYNIIKMEATQSTAAHKRKLLNAVPLLSVLSQVPLLLDCLRFQAEQALTRTLPSFKRGYSACMVVGAVSHISYIIAFMPLSQPVCAVNSPASHEFVGQGIVLFSYTKGARHESRCDAC